jgi:hypothetical protein
MNSIIPAKASCNGKNQLTLEKKIMSDDQLIHKSFK